MKTPNRRSRQVSFRVSEDEYDCLLEFCTANGGQSISDLARSAIFTAVGSRTRARVDVIGFDSRVRELSLRVEQLARLLNLAGTATA